MNNIEIDETLRMLKKSKFRSGFRLSKKMRDYVSSKGIETVQKHCYDFIEKRLAPANPLNDGRQTPMRQVHPVFIAQHACACCCRSCLEKWHHIPKNRDLTSKEVDFIVELLIEWIKRECRAVDIQNI